LIFRKDINGLRAIAVLPVIFFHSGLSAFSGGFLGVDVFFVISGFLITSNIINNQSESSFSLLEFYDKRARRILPPLFLTILITTFFSFLFMLPYDLKNYGQSIVATSLGANNILLYLTSGYWSLASDFKPLYHTWSLGVEEQYYFIIPIIFILFFKSRKLLLSILLILFLVSFFSSYFIESKEFNFLIIVTRFWELCAGSLLAIYMRKKKTIKNEYLSGLGLLFIFFSYVNPYFFSSNQLLINLLPVLGTIMVIAFTKQEGFVYKNLSRKPFLMIGLTSYSVYLFHQPILSFLKLATETPVNTYIQLSLSLLSLPLAYFSWRFIESPFRSKDIFSHKKFYTVLCFTVFSCVSTGFFLHKSYGMQNYDIFEKYSYGVNPQAYADRAYSLEKEKFSSSSEKMLIIGNSFARDFYNALEENGATSGYEVVYLYDYYKDLDLSRSLLEIADVVFWVSSAGMAGVDVIKEDLTKSAIQKRTELERYSGDKYYYVGTKNYGFNNNFIKLKDWNETKDYMVEINSSSISANNVERKVFSENYVSLMDLFRVDNKTRIFTDDHKFISFDTEHITKYGAIYLGNKLLRKTSVKNILL